MTTHEAELDQHGLQTRLRILRRRKWLILQVALIVPAAAVAFSLHQPARYRASADVLLGQQSTAAQAISATTQALLSQDPQRLLDTQAALAREPAIARRVIEVVGLRDRSTDHFLAHSSVAQEGTTNLITFSVTDGDQALAIRLAATYAQQYELFERQLDSTALQNLLKQVRSRLKTLLAADVGATVYAGLVNEEQQLETLLALQTSNASVVRTPDKAVQVQPRPVRNGIVGALLGVILGIGLGFLREALDTRVRTAKEIGARLGLPLLARLPEPGRRLRNARRLTMLERPLGPEAEPFRMLRTNLEFANLEVGARVIMVTSAVEREGKSTSVANLAVALARAGQRVILVDLDLRRPFLHHFFDRESHPGVTDVALGRTTLADALVHIPIAVGSPDGVARSKSAKAKPAATSNGKAAGWRTLAVLTSGSLPPDPGEFVGTRALAKVLQDVRELADIVLIDAPPLLHVSDALTLSASVDAMIVMARMDVVRRPMLVEVERLLASCPAAKLGFVLTGAGSEGGYGYGYGYGYGQSSSSYVPAEYEPAR